MKPIVALLVTFAFVAPLQAGEVARADLDILGLGLEVDRNPVVTAVDVPAYVQTIFGGKMNDEAPAAPGLSAIGELTGPGIATPITLAATPGRKFALPALHEKGEYALQNIRLVGENGEFLQQAVPSFAVINVTEVLKTEVRARQLTPDELRERGITVDLRNFEVYEYTIIVGVGEERVEIPYEVVVDKRTNALVPVPRPNGYGLPKLTTRKPPRYHPPQVDYWRFGPGPDGPDEEEKDDGIRASAPSLPAAIVVPSGFGVLHQFFAVIVQVSNGAPDGSNIRIDSIKATIAAPQQMRVTKVTPAVTLGQPVPIRDAATGATFLVAGAQGEAEWILEALKTGTHNIEFTVEGMYQKPGQQDVPLRGRASTTLVVSDPRFQINFSHPDTVREDEAYTAYAFVTNLSAQAQHVRLDMSEIPDCSSGGSVGNVCRTEGSATVELDIQPGDMIPVPYKLTSRITGNVFAGAGSANDEALGVSVKLHMGVSESGIPLSPATLVMPHYAKYLPPDFVAANMQLLGLGYSLATAPLNQYTARFPRLIKNDVFQRAGEITRAGQRIFVARNDPAVNDAEENRDALFHLSLDLLGNVERIDHLAIAPDLFEWDELRRMEKSGRRAGAAMARQLELHGLHNGRTSQQFVDDFAAATSHRTPFVMAYAHGAGVTGEERPYALALVGLATGQRVDVPAEATTGWVRMMPYAELTRFDAGSERGEMAMVGRVSEAMRVVVTPQTTAFTLHLIYPDTADGAFLRSDVEITNAIVGNPVWIDVARGSRVLIVNGASGTPAVNEVVQPPLAVIGAAQDLHLNPAGHLVSILFNRPLRVDDVAALRDRFTITTNVPKASYSVTRRNNTSDPNALLQVPSAALQQDARQIDVTFDKAMSRNAEYVIGVDSLLDRVANVSFADDHIVPRIDNVRPGGILTGRVLGSDNSPIANAVVTVHTDNGRQLDLTGADGKFLFEFIERDIDRNIFGNYELGAAIDARSTKVHGAVRLVGEVHTVNLVFLGRGTVRGHVRQDDGTPVAGAVMSIGSALHGEHHAVSADDSGYYEATGVAVGPITVSAKKPFSSLNPSYASNVIRTPGEVITQDLVIMTREYRGSGTVRVTVRRSDTNAIVPEAVVGVQTSGYSLSDGFTDANGVIEFKQVPAGLLTIIASNFTVSRESLAAMEVDLKADQLLEQTIVLPVSVAPAYSTLEGVVWRDDPASPGDRSKDQVVPGAILKLGPMPAVTANADGSYVYPDIPPGVLGPPFSARLTIFDPATGRKGSFATPSLLPGTVQFNPRLSSVEPEGYATVRVRLKSATGQPVDGYRVFEPGYPPTLFAAKGDGVYELTNVRVPNRLNVVAVGDSDGPYGYQLASGTVRVDFAGQAAVLDLRLPGQGTVITRIEVRQPDEACPVAPCYAPAFGRVALQHRVWDEFEQGFGMRTVLLEADQSTQANTFTKVPAGDSIPIHTDQHPAGFASTTTLLNYDGDVRTLTLRLESLGDVTGRVFAHDGQTPISGGLVKLTNGRIVYGSQLTKPDGSFRFPAVQAGLSFRVIAEYTQDGIYRTGFADGRTPDGGGPVGNLLIVMREQSSVEGQIVDADGNPVPLAYYWARELAWPSRSFGTAQEPLQSDINGRFVLQNIFTGPVRISARSPVIQEERGEYQNELRFEGDTSLLDVKVPLNESEFGTLTVVVVDSLQAYQPVPNAEVVLDRIVGVWRRIDAGSTDDRGIVVFHDIPAGTYSIGAYSKTVGRAGRSGTFTVGADESVTRQIDLDFLGKVGGTVTDPESEPVANAPAKGVAVDLGVQNGTRLRDTADLDGSFAFLGVPEGELSLSAFDFETGRMAFGPTGLFISKVVQEHNDIRLELERTATLNVKVYLPNDTGAAGELAPLVAVSVEQWVGGGWKREIVYLREQQGNDLAFPRMITRHPYRIVARELGGEQRTVSASGGFAANEYAKSHSLVFTTSGTVEVKVVDGTGQPVADARVEINGTIIFTNAEGMVTLSGVPLGNVGVQAKKDNFGASASGTLQSRSIPLKLTLNLGNTASVSGKVEAEESIGLPSPNTRVVMTVTSSIAPTSRLQTFTAADGTYSFSAVPIGSTRLSFLFYGPDDTTIGAELSLDVPNGTSAVTVPTVKLDATPPRVLSFDPPANTTNASPSGAVTITFSEPIAASFLRGPYFELIATDTSSTVNVSFQSSIRPDGTYQVKLIPPPPPAGQRFPLKSNVLYRVTVQGGVQDTTGNPLNATVGSSFTTVDYTEPAVVRVDPPVEEALPSNATLRVKFNKEIDLSSLDPGYGGVLKLEKLDTRGGVPVAEIPLSRYLDPADPKVIVAAPTGVAIEEASFYRLTVANIRDTQTPPNVQKDAKVLDYFSFDTKRPLATIVSPVAAGEKLISEVLYMARVEVVDEGTGATSTDVESVDWFDANGQFLKRVTTAPFSYSFTAPATTTGTTYTLKVSANDLSGNSSPELEAFTWDVAPNAAPANVVVTNTPASAYPTQNVTSVVTFTDEGLKVTVALRLRGTKLDGTPLEQILDSKQITRASTTAAWPSATFSNYALPLDLKAGTAMIVAEVTDTVRTGTGEAPLEILEDTIAPEVLSFAPAPETHYPFDTTFTVEVKVRDSQTGIKNVVISVAGADVPATHTFDASTGVHTYRHAVRVPAKNADTRIAIVAKAYDHRDNLTTSTSEVIYERVDDATIPQAAWITPLDQAAIPFGISGWQATLRIRATDDSQVTSVEFQSPAFAMPVAPVTAPKSGTTDVFEAKATFTLPENGAPFVVTAVVHDADPNHTVELPITLVPVVLDATVPAISTTSSISSVTAAPYMNKTLVVRGANVRVTITVPLPLENLVVLDGATVSTFEEMTLDLAIAGRVFIDADSEIDVSDEGYLGAHRVREDNSFRNDTDHGRTLGGATGANNASGSHAGIGGEAPSGLTNPAYGSITSPGDFGSGGAGTGAAGNGGGVVLLRGGENARFVVAGRIGADGGTGVGRHSAGSGGSIVVESASLITGPSTLISANGGDDDATSTSSAGGGGGRMAIRVGERLDVVELASAFRVHGGRNGSTDGSQFIDGGAGTFFLMRPGAIGELIVSSFDARAASSTHRTRGTVIADALMLDAITIGPRALARFDVAQAAPVNVDATALVVGPSDLPSVSIVSTVPAAGSQVAQSTSIVPTFTAASAAGITRARVVLSAQPDDTIVNLASAPASVPETETTVMIATTAITGPATLKIIATDRAGRIVESAPVPFQVVSNAVPVIDLFQVTPVDQIHAGGTIAISATASDDIEVTSLALASSTGTVTAQTATKPTPQSMSRQFSVALPKTTPSATNVVLTLSASDGFPNRAATTSQHTVVIRRDEGAPAAAITKPVANGTIDEIAGGTFAIEVSATDAEVGINTVKATFEGVEYTLLPVAGQPGVFAYNNVPIPSVDGTDPVAKTIAVAVTDFEPNTTTASSTVFIKPLVDPNAPKMNWVCSSPNAMYPVGYAAPLRVFAEGSSAQNGVQRVEFSIDGGAPIPATETAAGSKEYVATFTIPPGTAEGAVLNVRAAAFSTSGNEATLLGTITVVAGFDINTASEIIADDLAFENRSFVIRSGGVLTVVGTHTFSNIVILDGGRLVQKGPGPALNLQRLYVACNASIDVTGLGYAKNTTDPGAGNPDLFSGGSHIGHGGLWIRMSGGVFGSIYRPMEGGGGGQMVKASSPATAGGGIVRINASSSVAIDGTVTARGTGWTTLGASAGGSVWITTPATLSGAGSIDVSGGNVTQNDGGGGGGGSIALEYASASGTLLTKLSARGGIGAAQHSGGAGSIYLKPSAATYGSLVIDNTGVSSTFGATELPSFGRVRAASVNGNVLELDATRWLSPALIGHVIRTANGTWRIASITNDASTKPVNGFHDVPTQDAIAYDGYIYYSASGLAGRTFVAARYTSNRWEYDDDATFTPFTPQEGDGIIAAFQKDATSITNVTTFACAPSCGAINGVPMLELWRGEIVPNGASGEDATGKWEIGIRDNAELFLRSDSRGRGIIVSKGINASITLEAGAVVQPGDVLRGVYRFDSLKIVNARVLSEDLVEVTETPSIDATSSLVTGNPAAPSVDATRISIANGSNGPEIVGTAGAVSDLDTPLDVIARNTTRSAAAQPPSWNATPGVGQVLFGERGGISIERPANGQTITYGISTVNAITASGFVSFSASQTTKTILVGLAPADTTPNYAEPGANAFKLLSTGTYEVWSNGANANKNGTYTTSTVFRIEKTPAAIRWFVNETPVHERTSSIPAKLILDLSFQSASSGEIHSIEYDTTTILGTKRVAAAADGSFTLPFVGLPGEGIAIKARDGHEFGLESEAQLSVGNDIGVQSVTFAQAEVIGGRTVTGTVTLRGPAGSGGAIIALSSDNALASVPATVTIAAGQSSAEFAVTTQGVTTATDVAIHAEYGSILTSGALRLQRDTVAPAVTITSPAAGAQFNEGATTGIPIEVTAVDEDSGVSQVVATIDGVSTNLVRDTTKGPNVYAATLAVPVVDGTAPVSKTITVTAVDNSTNSGTANVSILVNPVIDTNPPTLTWTCFGGGMYPVGDVVTLRVTAKAPNATNTLQSVQFFITDPSGATASYAATRLANDEYEYLFTVPAVADGATFGVRALVTTVSGTTAELTRSLIAVADAVKITANTTIASTNTTYDGTNLVIAAGTTTIAGPHTFKRLIVQSGATVNHALGDKLDVQATEGVFVACGGAIDVTGRGYATRTTYPGATTPGSATGGSHIGYGGLSSNPYGSTYGSVVQPAEAGGGGSNTGVGGGIIRITAGTLVNDGAIRANGTAVTFNEGGAGGSIWITATDISGSGTIDANGGSTSRSGGGGAIAIEYTTAGGALLSNVHTYGGTSGVKGGAGSVYLKPLSSVYGTLVLDNGTTVGMTTNLPSLGGGVALSGTVGTTLATDRALNVPAYFVGHWVRITSAAGTVKGTWRIESISGKNVTLIPNGSESIVLAQGDLWQGIYRFDSLTVKNVVLVSADPIETDEQTLSGSITATAIRTTNLRISSGATLSHPTGGTLTIDASGELRIDAGSAIDVTGRGYATRTTYPGATTPGSATGGSHIGYGGLSSNPYGSTYGSVVRPAEAGAGGSNTGVGGGIVRISAGTLVNDGAIRANGTAVTFNEGGAGGSIWITATDISGSGTIDANGGSTSRSGGGGAIAIEYATASGTLLSNVHAYGGTSGVKGGAGSVYLKPASSQYGSITIHNGGSVGAATVLPSLGGGGALAGSGNGILVTDRATDIPPYFAGHWVEISGPDGALKGTWRIGAINAKTITLLPNGSEAIDVQPGDSWQGVYRFDNALLRTTTVASGDPWRVTNPIDKASTILDINDGPPVFVAALRPQIVVENTPTATSVIGPAGAVTDANTPIKLTVTNARTSATFTANANADGSFRAQVAGALGDTFTIRATDSHSVPASSAAIPVNGSVAESNAVASLSIRPDAVNAGATTYGIIELVDPARAGGIVVALSSSSAAATVPASVTVLAGSRSAQFPITTTTVSSQTTVTITATLGAPASATMTITPASAALADLVLSSSSVEGGASVNATVVLGAPAPAGGALVLLNSSSPAAIVPGTVLVAEGTLEATFTIATTKVGAATAAMISAAWGASRSATLSLTACSAMDVATPPVSLPMKTMWIDDALPSGATATGTITFDSTHFASGTSAIHFTPPAPEIVRTFGFTGASPLAVTPTDTLVLYALVNPCDPPRQILATWTDGATNWRASWGESRIDATVSQHRAGAMPSAGIWTRLEVLASTLGITSNKNLTGLTIRVDGGEVWIDAIGVATCSLPLQPRPDYVSYERIWFDDATPTGAAVQGEAFNWDSTQVASENVADLVPLKSGQHEHGFTQDPNGFRINQGDILFAYVLIDPCNPPREVELQWQDGSAWHRAYWGENLLLSGAAFTTERRKLGALPAKGEWVRLEVPAGLLGLEDTTVRGMAWTLYDGRAWFDRMGAYSRVNVALNKAAAQSSEDPNAPNCPASKAVDGDLSTFNHTKNDPHSWLEIDLGEVLPIEHVVLQNRIDCCTSRLHDFYLFVSEDPLATKDYIASFNQPNVFFYAYTGSAGPTVTFTVNRRARYLRVQLNPQDFLHVREMQVWAPATPAKLNVIGGTKAWASTIYDGWTYPSVGVDSHMNDPGGSGASIFHTAPGGTNQWWQTDLQSVQPISTLEVIPRWDCCPEGLQNFYVLVSDVPFTSDDLPAALAQTGVSAYYFIDPSASHVPIQRTGRYVRVQKNGTGYIAFSELRLWSHAPLLRPLAKPVPIFDFATAYRPPALAADSR